MPGHGASQVRGSKVTLRDMPDIINQLMAELQIPVVHLLGVSMGPIVAQTAASSSLYLLGGLLVLLAALVVFVRRSWKRYT